MLAYGRLRFIALLLSAAFPVAGASASDMTAPPLRSPWTIEATPYAWLPFLDGTSTIRNRSTDIDLRPFQVLEDLKALPWMSYVEARNGRLSFYNDIFYAKLGTSGSGVRPLNFGSITARASLDFEQLVIEGGATYEVARWVRADSSVTALDVLAGARYWHQELTVGVDVAGSINIGGFEISGSRAFNRAGSVDWVDPLIGLRLRHGIAPGREIMFRADIGGFGVGSDFSWNVIGAYSFDLAYRDGIKYSGMLGYRALDVDYTDGSGPSRYGYDVLQHGPIMGLTLSF